MCDPGEESAPSRVIGFLPQHMRFFYFLLSLSLVLSVGIALHAFWLLGLVPGVLALLPSPHSTSPSNVQAGTHRWDIIEWQCYPAAV